MVFTVSEICVRDMAINFVLTVISEYFNRADVTAVIEFLISSYRSFINIGIVRVRNGKNQ